MTEIRISKGFWVFIFIAILTAMLGLATGDLFPIMCGFGIGALALFVGVLIDNPMFK